MLRWGQDWMRWDEMADGKAGKTRETAARSDEPKLLRWCSTGGEVREVDHAVLVQTGVE